MPRSATLASAKCYNAIDCFQPAPQRGGFVRRSGHRLRGRGLWRWAALGPVLALLRAQTPALNSPAPLASPPVVVSSGEATVRFAAAARAHALGQLSTSAALYRDLLGIPGTDRPAVVLALASVLLDAGEAGEARDVLQSQPAPASAAWQLRLGLASLQLRQRSAAQAAADAIRPDQLSAGDRPWHLFLQGALFDTLPARDGAAVARANQFYSQALATATTDLARARFQIAAERVRLRLAPPAREALDQARRLFDQWQGRVQGHEAARDYAVMLARLDRRGDAIQFLQREVLLLLPAQDRGARDEFNFLVGLIAGARSPVGRTALVSVVAAGVKPERQRQALQLLFESSPGDSDRAALRTDLDQWLGQVPPHPLRETLLLFRAQVALVDKEFSRADEEANRLLRDYPASGFRAQAFGVVTQAAWAAGRFRLAADAARRTREALAGLTAGEGDQPSFGRVHAELGVLEAEAWFRAGLQTPGQTGPDFRSSADAYAAVLRDRAADLDPRVRADVMFQRVLAEIRSGSGEAARVLDTLALDPALDVENRWLAEWSLARSLQLQGENAAAFARVSRLLGDQGAASAAVPAALRARMAWLQARLSFDAGQFRETLALVERLRPTLTGLEPALRTEIASTVALLQARAQFALGAESEAIATLRQLREQHQRTPAAEYSYLVESAHFEGQGRLVDAQLRLNQLVDSPDYRESEYVPYALFQLALLSEQLGGEENLKTAAKRIEDLVTNRRAAAQDLVFRARLKQGDLFRRLSQFPQARQAYEYLINNYSRRPDVVLAHLALAECYNAESAVDPGAAEAARLKFEELRDRVDAPADVRVEAGYNLGKLLERLGRTEEAAKVWMLEVARPFLIEAQGGFEAGARRPYWLARTLLDLAALRERQGRFDEAIEANRLLLRQNLGEGGSVARRNLERLGAALGPN